MHLDELKLAWTAHSALLERSVALDERILREMLLGKVRRALAPYALGRALEVLFGVIAFAATMRVLLAHLSEPVYVVIAGAVVAWTLLLTALCVYLLVGSLQLDYGGTVTALQRDIERIRLVEYRALKWALLGGVFFWLPMCLLLFEALAGVDALARVNAAWFVGNLLFGVVVFAVGQMLSRKYVERTDLDPRAHRLLRALTGHGLRSASDHLAELAAFQRDDSSS